MKPTFPNGYATFYITRHGETEWNLQDRLQGHLDSPLTENGINQAKQVALELGDISFDAVFSSDLGRAEHTARIIATEKQLAVSTTQLLREQNGGDDQGTTFAERRDRHRELLERYEKMTTEEQMNVRFNPSAETQAESVARFITFLREIAVGYLHRNILIITHAGTMRNFLIHLGVPIQARSIKNTAQIIIQSDGVDFFIESTKNIEIKQTA